MPGSRSFPVFILAILVLCSNGPAVLAQSDGSASPPTVYWPHGVGFDESITSPRDFFGFEIGHRHLRHDQVVAYLRQLASESDRVLLEEYGQTHDGRPLLLLTIAAPGRLQQQNEIRQRHRQLAQPRSADDPPPDLDGLPVVLNMGYGVHGDEPSATNTAPLVAHYLAAARGPEIDRLLDRCIVLLDPCLNPDGFDRFARWANTFRGRVPNPDPAHLEHRQGWPPGRVNYYWFDLNRDWLPLVHPESQSRMNWYHRWKPNVVLDFHEMGTDSTYFFQPGVPRRTNPLTPADNIQLTRELATFHARSLDERGSLYFTQEVFDDFYMGKGSTYPDLHGAVGILFEQASSRGHVQESDNGLLEFSDTIGNQFTASLSSLQGVQALREKLLDYQAAFYRQSLAQAADQPIDAWVFQMPGNPTRLNRFADILLQHDIRCYRTTAELAVDGQRIAAGSLVVPSAQPEYRFLRSLVDRRRKFRENVFYDVSAWTLPLAFNLKQSCLRQPLPASLLSPVNRQPTLIATGETVPEEPAAERETPTKIVALLFDWRDDQAVPLLQELLDRNCHVRIALKPFTSRIDGQPVRFDYGTMAIPLGVTDNRDRLDEINRLVIRYSQQGIRFSRLSSGRAAGGIDLGSNHFPRVQPRKVALLAGRGVSAYQAGAAWHQLDHRSGVPVSLIRHDQITQTDWDRYTTLIVPAGRYELSEAERGELRRFVRRGGTLIALGRANESMAGPLLDQEQQAETADSEKPETAAGAEPAEPPAEDAEPPLSLPRFADARDRAALKLVSGAIFQTRIDRTHPLLFGVRGNRLPVFRTSARPLRKSDTDVSNPIRYHHPDPLLAGYASAENRQLLAGTPAVSLHSLGQGHVVLFADDPNFRGFWPATSRVFMNAVLLAPFCDAPDPESAGDATTGPD